MLKKLWSALLFRGSRGYKFSLVKKLVLAISGVALITYSFSAIFLLILDDFFYNVVGLSELGLVALTLVKGVFWSALLGYMISKVISHSLIKISEVAEVASTGDLRCSVEEGTSDDEIRALAKAFNTLISSLRQIISEIEGSFKQTASKVDELNEITSDTTESAEQLSNAIEEIAHGAERQASAAQSSLDAVQNLAELANNISGHGEKTRAQAQNMMETIQKSSKVVAELVQEMYTIVTSNEKSNEIVNRLQNNANEIGNISAVVGDIAEQTNLLALNASIEAARAGEHGRGFAVVAEEVRKLADQSATAVGNINNLIAEMQKEVKSIVLQINDQVKIANAASQKGDESKTALQEINSSVEEVVAAIKEIEKLVKEQVELAESTEHQARSVAEVAEETAASAQEMSASSQQQTAAMHEVFQNCDILKSSAVKLKEVIDRFKT